jgi:hypothetical protein
MPGCLAALPGFGAGFVDPFYRSVMDAEDYSSLF